MDIPGSSPSNRVEALARVGYAAKGVIYLIIGVLAVQIILGGGGEATGAKGALSEIGLEPFGRILLGLMALGLLGYVAWCFYAAAKDPEHEGSDAKGMLKRIGFAVSGILYLGLAFLAGRAALTGGSPSSGSGGSGGGGGAKDWTAKLMSQPFGQILVGVAAIIIVIVGIRFFVEAYRAKFMQHYDTADMSAKTRKWVRRVGRFGISSQGVVFCTMGIFLGIAAIRANPNEAKGFGEALAALQQQPYGAWILGLVGLGVIAYAAYCFANALYYQVRRRGTRPI